jgi:predicted Rdx family selenoprotein
MNAVFKKKFTTALWLILAGTIAQVLTLFADNISEFGLSPLVSGVSVIVCTSLVATITKILNTK